MWLNSGFYVSWSVGDILFYNLPENSCKFLTYPTSMLIPENMLAAHKQDS